MPQFTATTLAQDPDVVVREINTWASSEAVQRLKAIGVRCIDPVVHESVVDAVLGLPWRTSESLSTAVLDFALELVGAVPAFNKAIIDALITSWLPASLAPGQAEPPAEQVEATLKRVHETLRGVLRVTPLAIR